MGKKIWFLKNRLLLLISFTYVQTSLKGMDKQGAVPTQSQNPWQVDTKDGHSLPEIAYTVREASRTCKM